MKIAFAADHAVRVAHGWDRDDAVERLHEVRDEQRLLEAEGAAVEPAERFRQVDHGEAVHLEEELERLCVVGPASRIRPASAETPAGA